MRPEWDKLEWTGQWKLNHISQCTQTYSDTLILWNTLDKCLELSWCEFLSLLQSFPASFFIPVYRWYTGHHTCLVVLYGYLTLIQKKCTCTFSEVPRSPTPTSVHFNFVKSSLHFSQDYLTNLTRGWGQWPEVTERTGQNQCVLLLEKSVCFNIWQISHKCYQVMLTCN